VTRIDENGNTGQLAGNYAIVVDEMIVRMEDIGAIDSQLSGDLKNYPRTGSPWFLKSVDFYSGTLCIGSEPARMSQAVDCRFMTFSTLTLREVEYHPLQPSHIEIVDELN
jgi:hypothetical protein